MVIKRPTECINACCGAICSSANYQFNKGIFGDNPRKCPNYVFYEAPSRSEVKNGKWILVHPLQEDDEGGYMCSECKTGYYDNSHWRYCPNCGAKMESEEKKDV